MTWPLALVAVAALAAFVAFAQVALPYFAKRPDTERRIEALETANVETRDLIAKHEEVIQYMANGARLPRAGAKAG